jgi:outer membrane protein assembly factor BamD (BamD/ComL family)
MKTIHILIIGVLAVAMTACTSKENSIEKIASLEKGVYSDSAGFNKEIGENLVDLYVSFADKFKDDSLAPMYLYKAAKMSIELNKCDKSSDYLDRVVKGYPKFRYVQEATFIKDNIASINSKKMSNAEEVKSVIKAVFDDPNGFNTEKASGLTALFALYAENNKSDALSPFYLFNAGNLSVNLKKGNDALRYFNLLASKYPNDERIAQSMFLKGYVYEELFHNINKAREAYTMLMEKYPESEYASIAEASINNLGKTPEQILIEAQEKNKQDSLAKK